MRRFDVYFLQKRDAAGWETVERAQSASVLVSSMIREFDGEEDAELRVVGGDWNATVGEWEFSQIFFVDRGSIDLSLAEPSSGEEEESGDGAPSATGGSFAEAIHAARREADAREGSDSYLDPALTASEAPPTRRRSSYDDTAGENEDLRSLRFRHDHAEEDEPVGPPPDFRPEPRRSGRAYFMIGTVVIALILILGAAAALMVAFKVDPAPRYIEMLRHWKDSTIGGAHDAPADSQGVMPQTAGETERHAGVAPDLQGRWSSGNCDGEYIEFGPDSFVVKADGRDPSVAVPVVETLEDEYTWYIRRSETLVEHFQKLGADDIQMIGDTTPVGFTQRTSEVYTRCPS
ncbi:hypothetical protein T8K17_14530 [Thalassobaculum sp. OXR-137]|uniref:hypothetical protein n=1 Tax=Thalassobaculum sp. OXR-137 TaxID=3100173 RepID=UPI002AC90B31|nr:hypothetical protein [Thalassobaculum sp. OXR-137]WPZ32457.1 hypothetical protein T8K17_14530 [Thalassobaculum sp. OXR-137]